MLTMQAEDRTQPLLPISLRTATGEAAYQEAKLNGGMMPLADETSIKDFVHWRVIDNRFMHDTVAFKKCHMLIPRRVFPNWQDINPTEFVELQEIITELAGSYDQLTMNMPHNRSVPGHFHLHLNKFYDSREQMKL